jgi:hypothetical protein
LVQKRHDKTDDNIKNSGSRRDCRLLAVRETAAQNTVPQKRGSTKILGKDFIFSPIFISFLPMNVLEMVCIPERNCLEKGCQDAPTIQWSDLSFYLMVQTPWDLPQN